MVGLFVLYKLLKNGRSLKDFDLCIDFNVYTFICWCEFFGKSMMQVKTQVSGRGIEEYEIKTRQQGEDGGIQEQVEDWR